MSCTTNTTTSCNPCCAPAPVCDATNEALASQLNNLLTWLIGVITKSCDSNNNVVWSLPCNLGSSEPLAGYAKLANEGIICYILRVFPLYIAAQIAVVSGTVTTLTSTVNGLKVRALHGFVEVPSNKTYVLMAASEIASTINNIRIGTLAGTCTVAININGVAVTGLGAIAVTGTEQTVAATALNTLAVNDRVTMVVSANAASTDMEFSLKYTST